MKFKQGFLGVKDGEIYPTKFEPGDDCPLELQEAATICGVLEDKDQGGSTDKDKETKPAAPETK